MNGGTAFRVSSGDLILKSEALTYYLKRDNFVIGFRPRSALFLLGVVCVFN